MKAPKSFPKSSLVLALAFMALLFNACRKSSSNVEDILPTPAPSKFSQITGTYVVIDTMTRQSYGLIYTYYDTLEVKVSCKNDTMIQFDELLIDRFVYDYTTRTMDSSCTKYRYYSYTPGGYYMSPSIYEVNVSFRGNEMYYSTYSSVGLELRKGKGVKR